MEKFVVSSLNQENLCMLSMMPIFMELLLLLQHQIVKGLYNIYIYILFIIKYRIITGGNEGEVRVWKIGKQT